MNPENKVTDIQQRIKNVAMKQELKRRRAVMEESAQRHIERQARRSTSQLYSLLQEMAGPNHSSQPVDVACYEAKGDEVIKRAGSFIWAIRRYEIEITDRRYSYEFNNSITVPTFEVSDREMGATFASEEEFDYIVDIQYGTTVGLDEENSQTLVCAPGYFSMWLDQDFISELHQVLAEVKSGQPQRGLPVFRA